MKMDRIGWKKEREDRKEKKVENDWKWEKDKINEKRLNRTKKDFGALSIICISSVLLILWL